MSAPTSVAEAVGRTVARMGTRVAFGLVGSGNFHVTNALVAGGMRFVAARHECGAATMADAYARMSGELGVVSVHQGPGLTNAMTGIAEAAKSRTPLLVLAGEATDPRSNFHIGQDALVAAVGAVPMRVNSAGGAVRDTIAACRTAVRGRRPVLLNLPLAIQRANAEAGAVPDEPEVPDDALLAGAVPGGQGGAGSAESAARPDAGDVERLADALAAARRPVFVAGRGARRARAELVRLARLSGALLATSAVANGLFQGEPWDLGISGGFGTPLSNELTRGADLIVGWGCALNLWTMRHGDLIGHGARVVQVDLDPDALGAHRPVDLGVRGDVADTARRVADRLGLASERRGYRSAEVAARIAAEGRWRLVPYEQGSGEGTIDPRTLTIALDDLLPRERIVAPDSGNFLGYPSAFLSVPDEYGFCFSQGFQSVGLGLATAIGAALARPDRLPVAALGDGGLLMGVAELETAVRLGLPLVIVVYDDEAYGAEVHHFGPEGHPLDTVTFPPVDLAAVARGYGCAAVTVREPADLAGVAAWLDGPRSAPLLVDAKVTADRGAWWVEDAFRSH